MISRKKTGKALAASIVVLAVLSLTLAACSASSSSSGSANDASGSTSGTASSGKTSSEEIMPVEIDTEGIALENSYTIEGFIGAESGSDEVPDSDAKMLTLSSVEVSYPTTWKIVETQVREYQESKFGTIAKNIVLEGPTGLQVSVTLAASKGGGARDGDIEVIGPTGIEDVWLAWGNSPEYGSSFPQYINQQYIDEQEAGILRYFPGLACLQEGFLYGSIYAPTESGGFHGDPNRNSYADNADLNAACAILESVRLA